MADRYAIDVERYIPPNLRGIVSSLGLNDLANLNPVTSMFMRPRDAAARYGEPQKYSPTGRRETSDLVEAGMGPLEALLGVGITKALKQPAKEGVASLFGVDSGQPEVDDIADPSRRRFLGGLASLPVAAAVTPDLLSDLATAAKKTGKPTPMGTFDGLMSNVRLLRRELLDLQGKRDQVLEEDSVGMGNMLDEIDDGMVTNSYELSDYTFELVDEMLEDPSIVDKASDESLEGFMNELYRSDAFDIDSELMSDERAPRLSPVFDRLRDQIRERGLHKAKTEEGYDEFPFAKTFYEDAVATDRAPQLDFKGSLKGSPSSLYNIEPRTSEEVQAKYGARIRNSVRNATGAVIDVE